MYCTNEIRACTIFATAQQPHSRDIFLNEKIMFLDKLINQQEVIFAYKVINGMYLLGDNLTDRHDLHNYQFRNAATHSQLLFVIELSKLGIVYLHGDLRRASSLPVLVPDKNDAPSTKGIS